MLTSYSDALRILLLEEKYFYLTISLIYFAALVKEKYPECPESSSNNSCRRNSTIPPEYKED